MIRPTIPEDTPTLLAITEGTGLFSELDLEALDSVLLAYHDENVDLGHRCVTYEQHGQIVGFTYYAPAAMTERTWYLWWIVRQQADPGERPRPANCCGSSRRAPARRTAG